MIEPKYYQIENMHCGSCVAKIEASLKDIPNINQASVNFADHSLMIIGSASDDLVINTLSQVGYRATLKTFTNNNENFNQETAFLGKSAQKFIVALIIGLLLMISDYIYPYIPALDAQYGQITWLVIGFISLFVMLFSGGDIFLGAWKTLLKGTANMDSLIALGTGAAWIYSMLVVLFYQYFPTIAHGMYFDTAVFIIALVKLGSWLEARARGKTSAAIQRLIGLQPKTAIVVQNKQETEIPITAIKAGMLIRIRPGAKIPVDGIIIEGESAIDQSMLTGEAMPVTKHVNDEVITGTLNKSGSFIFKATQVGGETTLAKIINLVKQAQNSKPQIGRLVDKIAAVFVPIVLAIAVSTAIIWYFVGPTPSYLYALITAITVLVIACPCALGLGTPMSLMVGIGKAAENGILIRNGNALQSAGELSTIVLDKTGTITKGLPEVTQMFSYHGFIAADILKLAAAAEKNSEHPLAEAIVKYANTLHLSDKNEDVIIISNFKNFPGKGVIADAANQTLIVGNKTFMLEHKINIEVATPDLKMITTDAATPAFIAIDGTLAGLIAIADPIKDDSKLAIQQLQQLGIEVLMLTGDHVDTAKVIAAQVGVNDFFAECLPDEKHTVIKNLQQKNKIVAMVGDGINDAPALAQANVGFAIGAGTDVAIESADVTLMANSLQGVVHAIRISKATMRNIKQNLFGAFIYNVIGIPIAAGVLYPFFGILLHPVIAAAAMAASSLTIVMNANRLRYLH